MNYIGSYCCIASLKQEMRGKYTNKSADYNN